MMAPERTIEIDFETRSACNIKKAGAHRYSVDPTTQMMCLAWSLPDVAEPLLWHPPYPAAGLDERGAYELRDLHRRVELGELVEAHNAMFERCIWTNVGHARMGWPAIRQEQMRCSAAKAAAYGIPRGLDEALKAMRLEVQKDKEGHRLMLKLSKPRRALKRELDRVGLKTPAEYLARFGLLWHESDPDELNRLFEYCRQDIRAERALSTALPPLLPEELRLWLMDQRMNWRGVAVDVPGVRRAIEIAEGELRRFDQEMASITFGAVPNCRKRADLLAYVQQLGVAIPDLKAPTIDLVLQQNLNLHARRVLTLRRESARASIKKLHAIEARVCPDGRVRDLLVFCGAAHTGRFCLTGDHEVLTESGWVRLDQWRGGTIACWNQNEQATFQHAEVVSFPFGGELLRLRTKRIDQLSTPEHKMPAWTSRGVFDPREVSNLPVAHRVPYTGSLTRDGVSIDPDGLRVLVMVQADGHYAEDGQIRLGITKRRKIERCRRLLRRAAITYVEREYEGKATFTVARRHVPLFLRMFDTKTFGWWLLGCDLDVFFDELELWDGYRCGPNSIQYGTTNRQNAEIVQALAHLSGRAACVVEKSGRKSGWSTVYYVNVWLRPSNRHETHRRPVRESFAGTVYCAVTPTGYFYVRRNGAVWITGNSGSGIQTQNLPRGSIKSQPAAWAELMAAPPEWIRALYGDVLVHLAGMLRGAIMASPGRRFIASDFSAIESCVLFWLAGCNRALAILRGGGSLYKDMAGAISGVPDPQKNIKKGTQDYQLGKQSILGLGYQMGAPKFVITCAGYAIVITEEFSKTVVELYRSTYPEVPQLWWRTEAAALEAVRSPGQVTSVMDRVHFRMTGPALRMRLPSGRCLTYMYPKIRRGETPWGAECDKLEYMGVDSKTHRWSRQHTYGGKLVENAVQAISRDLLRDAMFRAEDAGYDVVLTTHDEIVADQPVGTGSLHELDALMAGPLQPWAAGCPVSSEGWESVRYRK